MSAMPGSPVNPPVDVKIVMVKGERANWFVKPLKIHANTKVTWHCRLNGITIWFPSKENPLKDSKKNEIRGKNGRASAAVGSKKGVYHYCILVTDEKGVVHLVEGNSPPTMVID